MQEKIHKKIEDAMHSIDGIEKATPPPFFFTRLEARLQREKNIWEKITSFVVQPAIAFAAICLIIMMNAMVIFSSSDTKKTLAQQNTELATVDEYSEVNVSLYDYENIKP
jgi:uncharacterized membrane protein YdfJ with MMPL/SSD domain